jgi:hypothetical protein
MKAKSCKDCQFVKSWKVASTTSTRYQCRYGPPTAMGYIESSFHIGNWPEVLQDGWCWQFKEDKVEGGRRWDDEI